MTTTQTTPHALNESADVAVIGSYVQDLAFSTASFPAPGETRIGLFRAGPGGKGFNQAIACHRQGVNTLFLGAVGEDIFAEGVAQFAKNEKLRAEFEKHPSQATGAASIVVNQHAENLIVVALGANDYLSPAHINRFEMEISSAKVLVSQLECSLEAVESALTLGRKHGVTTILNPAPINDGVTEQLLGLADIITPNETEFRFLMQKLFNNDIGDDYWNKSDQELHELCRRCEVPTVVLTLGKNGCFVSHSNESTLVQSSGLFYRESAISVSPVDTTGAGDAFNGGLAAGLVHYPGDFRKAIKYATIVGGLSTLKEGTAPSMPSQKEVRARLSF